MIRTQVRDLLKRSDAELALRLIARGSAADYQAAEAELREHGIDALLDDPRLYSSIRSHDQGLNASLPLFTYVAVRFALRDAGEDDQALADFLASVLLQFGLRDRAWRVSTTDDQTYATVADIAHDIDDSNPQRSFLVRLHMGNHALWLSGVFPDFVETRRRRKGGPDIDYYEDLGRRGYNLAADHRLAAEHHLAPVLRRAAERFLVMRVALNSLSDTLLFPNVHSPDRLMRQVRDAARTATN